MSAEVVLNQEFDYLMFLDDDVLVPFDCLTKLMACDADIASGDVLVRGYPFAHMSFRHPKTEGIVNRNGLAIIQEWKKKDPEIATVDAVGFSLVLIKAEVLKSVNKPYFVTGPQNTEDIYFCMKARQTNPDLTIVTHRGIVCQHILWPEIIGPDNAKWYRTYYEKYYGVGKKDNEDEFRGKKYLKIVKGALDV
jgi:GT2 family glycosyltransferase